MICVTGGAGFIGSHLVKRLLNENHKVCIIDNFHPLYDLKIKEKNIETLGKDIILYKIDIRDEDKLSEIFNKHSFDCIFHLAAMAGVRPSIKDPKLYSEVNIDGTINLLEQARKNKINNFIFASSSSVYGNNKKVPFSEVDSVDLPISPYAATKKAGELLCHTYHHLYNINITALRFFTVYGPSQRPEMAIHKFTRLISQGEEIPMYGDGSSSRDYTYVDDIIDGVYKAYKNLAGFKLYNLGESQTISLKDLINLIGEKLNIKPKIKQMPLQAGDVSKTFADISKAKTEINYSPQTNIEKGIENFVTWYKENF